MSTDAVMEAKRMTGFLLSREHRGPGDTIEAAAYRLQSRYGIPVAVDRKGNAFGPADLDLSSLTEITGWNVVEGGDEIKVKATGNGLAQVFARPNYIQAYGAWARYIKAHGYGVSVESPRNFSNEFDLVLLPADQAQHTGRQAIDRLVRGAENGSIILQSRRDAQHLAYAQWAADERSYYDRMGREYMREHPEEFAAS